MKVIGSLVKGLRILEFVAESTYGVRVSDVERALSIPAPNVAVFLNTLIQLGYVIKDPLEPRYFISEKIVHLGKRISTPKYTQLKLAAQESMTDLHAEFNENVILGVLNKYMVQTVLVIQSTQRVQITNLSEKNIAHATALGKAMLAYMPNAYIENYLKHADFLSITERTIVDKSILLEELDRVRERGFAINLGEHSPEIMAVAAPIFNGSHVTASLAVQFPEHRYRADDLPQKAAVIVGAATRVTERYKQFAIGPDGVRADGKARIPET